MNLEKRARGSTDAWDLIVQPERGVEPLVKAIEGARKRVEILIFRFDRAEIENALTAAVKRGVAVHALIAWTNRGGERNLRNLETRLLAAGVTVSRTADDLARYHGKMLIIDRKRLYLLAFNFTALDIDRSRSFGVSTKSGQLVEDAVRLFEADCSRQAFTATEDGLLVSPFNARKRLAGFVQAARKQLLIYDPCVGDPQMVQLLEERSRGGVEVRVIGSLKRSRGSIEVRPLAQMRLHTRTIVRDLRTAFIGSQSLRTAELDGRREIGMFVANRNIVTAFAETFEEDWHLADLAEKQDVRTLTGDKLAKKVAKAVTRELPPIGEVIEAVAAELPSRPFDVSALNIEQLEETIRSAVKTVVKESVQEAAATGGPSTI